MGLVSSINGSFKSGRRGNSSNFGIQNNNLIVHYDAGILESYSGSGTTFTDLSGLGNNGTIQGGPTFSNGRFTWTSNDFITTANLVSYFSERNTSHTTEVWCKPTGNGVVVSYTGTSDPYSSYHHSAIEIVSGYVVFGLWHGSGITSVASSSTITFGNWYQFTLVYSGNILKGYVNGELIGSTTITWDPPISNPGGFYIQVGASDVTNQGDGTQFDGDIGLLRVYSRKMNKPEVIKNKNHSNYNWSTREATQQWTSGTSLWKAPKGVRKIEYLVVGGGGGAGNGYDNAGGGGGAGGMVRTGYMTVTPGVKYNITVGAGGTGGADLRSNLAGSDGGSSSFGGITALGGGKGWGSRTGGSGGQAQVGSSTAPLGGYGHGGGGDGAGGGGAGGAGAAGGASPGAGGAGISSSISGTSITYGAGGAGGYNGGPYNGANGTANRGNGGTGGSSPSTNSASGGNGGSGIVIIKYLTG